MGYAVIIGGANIDICGTPWGEFVPRDSNPGRIRLTYGGVARNIAHELCLLGADVRFITAFGDDSFSVGLIESCRNIGMDISGSRFMENCASSVYNFITDKNGDMIAAVSDMEICANINSEFLSKRLGLINSADACFIDANNTKETLEYITKHCAVPIFCDPVSSVKAPRLKSVLSRIYTLKPNAIEASILTGIDVRDEKSAKESAEAFIKMGVGRVYISLGEKGVYASDGNIKGLYPARKINVVNTNGAGDSFTSALIFAYLFGYSFEESIKLGMTASEMCLGTEKTINEEMSAEALIESALKNKRR